MKETQFLKCMGIYIPVVDRLDSDTVGPVLIA